MTVGLTMTPFDQLTWGDPFLAQMSGSDAQAYATDPTAGVLQNMTTGFEQAPQALSEYVGGANQPAQQSGAGGSSSQCPQLTDCSIWNLIGKPLSCWGQCFNPGNYGQELSQGPFDSQARGAINATGTGVQNASGAITSAAQSVTSALSPKNFQGTIVLAIIGLLAVGLILLGAKNIMEV